MGSARSPVVPGSKEPEQPWVDRQVVNVHKTRSPRSGASGLFLGSDASIGETAAVPMGASVPATSADETAGSLVEHFEQQRATEQKWFFAQRSVIR